MGEAVLSAHIRHLLLDYVRCHITTDYVRYTELAVAELVPLDQIPEYDPASLILPADPFTSFSSIHKIKELAHYQEKFTTSQDARELLKKVICLPKGQPRSECLSWSQDAWHEDAFYRAEMILTRRAVRETPFLGKANRGLDISCRGLMTAGPLAFNTVIVEPIQEHTLQMNKILDVTYHLKAADHTAIRSLLQSVLSACQSQPLPPTPKVNDSRRIYLPSTFVFDPPQPITRRSNSPPLIPIFARNVLTLNRKGDKDAKSSCPPALRSYSELLNRAGAAVSGKFLLDSDDGLGIDSGGNSLLKENMVLVDGWQTYVTSSPSTYCSDDDNEFDELVSMLPLSPDTSVADVLHLVQDVEDSKLMDVQIPREKRICGSLNQETETIVDRARKAGGLGSFLAPFLGSTGILTKDINTELHPLLQVDLRSSLHMSHETKTVVNAKVGVEMDSDSMRGQASTLAVIDLSTREAYAIQEDDEILGLYQDLPCPGGTRLGPRLPKALPNPRSLIRDERLFDEHREDKGSQGTVKGDQLIQLNTMPIPILPEPNDILKPRPRNLSEYLVKTKEKNEPDSESLEHHNAASPMRFLKGVKGIAPLRVALSWVPFTRTTPIPIHAHIMENDLLLRVEGAEFIERDVRALLDGICVEVGNGDCGYQDELRWQPDNYLELGQDDIGDFSQWTVRYDIILTKSERRALLVREGDYTECGAEDVFSEVTSVGEMRKSAEYNVLDEGACAQNERSDVINRGGSQELVSGRDLKRDRETEVAPQLGKEFQPRKRLRWNIEDSEIGMKCDSRVLARISVSSNRGDVLGIDTRSRYADSGADDTMLLTESVQDGEEKENYPPRYMFNHASTDGDFPCATFGDPQTHIGLLDYDELTPTGLEETWDYRHDGVDAGGSFEPLSLSYDSQALSVRPSQSHEPQNIMFENHSMIQASQDECFPQPDQLKIVPEFATHVSKEASNIETPSKDLDPDLARHTLGIETFTKLRAKTTTTGQGPVQPSFPMPEKNFPDFTPGLEQEERTATNTASRIIPRELCDSRTIINLSPRQTLPKTVHKYMASLQLLQKQVLVRSLTCQNCLVELVERDYLSGVDLIIDPHTAVIFTPLLSLPSDSKRLLGTLSAQTWHYQRLLVVFEAYPASRSLRDASRMRQKLGLTGLEPELRAYTPPIIKAIKRFRRDLAIAEGCGKKASECEVWFAFADSVGQAALFARLFGDEAEQADETQGMIWGAREWLDIDASEDEANLASLGGMNALSASIILCQMTLQQLIDTSVEERTATLGPLLGSKVIDAFNVDIEQRLRTMEWSELAMSQGGGDVEMSTEHSC